MKKELLIKLICGVFLITLGTGCNKNKTDVTEIDSDSNQVVDSNSDQTNDSDMGTDMSTDSNEEVDSEFGALNLIGLKEDDHGSEYTSGRLNSNYNVPNTAGTWVQGRIKFALKRCDAEDPFVDGTWPSIWLLGSDAGEPGYDNETDWPKCGEIDINEWLGIHDDEYYQTNQWGDPEFPVDHNGPGFVYYTTGPEQWHTYGVRFNGDTITFTFDGEDQGTRNYDDPEGHTHRIILNLALGGDMGKAMADDFVSDTVQIDWVRVSDADGNILWSDEMNDETTTKEKWFPHVGKAYNNELQFYTNWEPDNFQWHTDPTLGECQ